MYISNFFLVELTCKLYINANRYGRWLLLYEDV